VPDPRSVPVVESCPPRSRKARRWLGVPLTVALVAAIAAPGATAFPDVQPAISAPADAIVGESDGIVDLTVRLSASSTQPVSVNYATANSTASASTVCNSDFVATSGTLNFAPGETTKVVHVQLNDCSEVEFLESFTLGLSVPINATIARASTRVSIIDNDTVVASPRVLVRDAIVDEKDGVALVGVLLGGPRGQASNSTVTVDYATHDGTAGAGADYTANTGSLTFAPGQVAKTIAVPIADDGAAEPSENFTLTLADANNATIADGTGTIAIGAGDAAATSQPRLSTPADAIVGEGDGYVDLAVRLSAPGSEPVAVNYSTANSTASASTVCNSDYVAVTGTLNFAPGETTKVVRAEVNDCNEAEALESFTFALSSPVNATIARAGTRISIIDNDTVVPTPKLFVRDAVVDEKDGVALVSVLLGGPHGQASNSTVAVDYATHDGTAGAGNDYTAGTGTLSFAPGQVAQTIAVPIADDAANEPAESFTLSLSNANNATIAGGTATVVIGAGDATSTSQPQISAPADVVVAEGDGYVDLVVRLSSPGSEPVAVNYSTANSTASASTVCNSDYVAVTGTLNFAPGETTKVVRVEINDCLEVENLESFTLGLSGAINAAIPRATARIFIVDGNVALISISVTPSTASIAAGRDQQFTATGKFSDGSSLDLTTTVTWDSSAAAVATITGAGLAHGVAGGTSTISASVAATSGSAQLTVSQPQGQNAQSIAFAPLASRTYGDPDFALSATATSGLPVSFVSSGSCTVAGVTMHVTGAGSCTITASQAGDSTHSAAPSVNQTFSIARAGQTIAFGALPNRRFGDADFEVGASASSGLAVTFTASGDCTVSAARVHLTAAGSCTLRASQPGNVNFNAAPDVSRAFSIARTPQSTPKCTVPNVVGKRLAAAASAIKQKHCRAGKVTRAFSRKVKKGRVISQSRKPGKVAPANTTINLVVSRGRRR
jgi:hypothetical protein